MLGRTAGWLDEVYAYISSTYGAKLLSEKPEIIFQDRILDSSLHMQLPSDPQYAILEENDRKYYEAKFGITLPKKTAMILPSEKAASGAVSRHSDKPYWAGLFSNLAGNYPLFIYSRVWHESFHDYAGSLPVDIETRTEKNYSISEISEFLPVAYTFFGLITGCEKGLAHKSETEKVMRTQEELYRMPSEEWGRYPVAMDVVFRDGLEVEDLIDMMNIGCAGEAKRMIERSARKILKEIHGIEARA